LKSDGFQRGRFQTFFGNELFMSEKYRNVSIFCLGILIFLINLVIVTNIYIERSEMAYCILMLITSAVVFASISCRKKFPGWSIFFLSLAVLGPISFYTLNSSFSFISLFSIFPLVGVCSYFVLGRPAAIVVSLYLIALAYHASFYSTEIPRENFLVEIGIYYYVLVLTFGTVFFVNLQIKFYESAYYKKQVSSKLENLSKTHKEQVDSFVDEIRTQLSDSYFQRFAERNPKGYATFLRAFGRIEAALSEIHRLSEREEMQIDRKVYRLWQRDED